MLGSAPVVAMATTTTGKSTFAGNAARNCATGWTRSAIAGCKPTHTPIGTQITLAIAMRTTTRKSVTDAAATAVQTSPQLSVRCRRA